MALGILGLERRIRIPPKPIYRGDADASSETPVQLVLMLDIDGLKFDCDILFRNDVDSMINCTCDGFW
jgi:hypothetical protein